LPNLDDKNLFQYHTGTRFKIEEFINYLLLKKVKTLGNPFLIDPNKLQVLEIANEIGLQTPKTTICQSSQETFFYFGKKPFITKLLVPLQMEKDKKRLNFFTLDTTHNELSSTFSPSLFQEKIEKKYEIRVFYLNGQCYCKAIFSQNDKKTEVDYRNYNLKKPNRVVPFLLPKNITSKLKILMDRLKLDTASIDLIVNKQNEFVFLEVNPVGQFSDMSMECNYFLEKKIMEYML
jgi:ATP-GRASP peptide maturase of grasp-with-spasm system